MTVDTIAKVRRAYFVQKRKIKAIARDLKLARNTVRQIIAVYVRRSHSHAKGGDCASDVATRPVVTMAIH